MGDVLVTTGSIGAGLLLLPLYLSAIAGPAAFAFWLFPDREPRSTFDDLRARHSKLLLSRWMAGLFAAVVWFFFAYPSVEAVKGVACRDAQDFKICMEGGDRTAHKIGETREWQI